MTDFVFDFAHWVFWRQLLFWTVNVIGLCSALIAFSSFDISRKSNTTFWAIVLFGVMLILLGLFPIEWGYNTDRANYANTFLDVKNKGAGLGYENEGGIGEKGYLIIQSLFSNFVNATQYLFCISLIYITNYFISIHRLVNSQSYWLFIVVVLSMGFTNYNVNTMRAGLALSFVVLGLSMYKSKIKMVICLLLATSIHTSTLIPVMMIGICYYFDKTPLYIKLWLLSVPVSFVTGGFFNSLFGGLSDDNRTRYLTVENTIYNIGFRIDFILYSLAPVIIGGYYIFKKKVRDRFYSLVYNSYLLTNIFWVLVIRANYSDRFAYLSWFLIPFVLTYPLLTKHLRLKENVWLGLILAGETMFRLLF